MITLATSKFHQKANTSFLSIVKLLWQCHKCSQWLGVTLKKRHRKLLPGCQHVGKLPPVSHSSHTILKSPLKILIHTGDGRNEQEKLLPVCCPHVYKLPLGQFGFLRRPFIYRPTCSLLHIFNHALTALRGVYAG